MKLDIYDNKYLVFLNRDFIKNVNFKIKTQVEECFRKIFTKIRKRLNDELNGFFNIKVYLNNDFGAILLIEKEENDYYDYYSLQIDMQIEIEYDAIILLEFSELFNINLKDKEIYLYKDNYYIKYDDDIKYIEFSNIIFGDKVNIIMNNGTLLDSICDI